MITELSILIPCYNRRCIILASELHRQATLLREGSLPSLRFEILMAEDGSTDEEELRWNKKAAQLPHCRHIIRGHNTGRAAIRNFLAREARHQWLLFIDCDMVARDKDFLRKYLRCDSHDVTYGGYEVNSTLGPMKDNLRFLYEKKYHKNSDAAARGEQPYQNFHTSNFMVRRDIMTRFPLDERVRRYGYEDVLWGKTLRDNGITIAHEDIPVSFESFESNASFLAKTEEGVDTLLAFSRELRGFSNLLDTALRLRRWRLIPLMRLFHRTVGTVVRRNLEGRKPIVALFPIYKLGLLCGKPNFAEAVSGIT